MGREVGEDRSGDQAAWRDLVARLELPGYVDPAAAPWPARENLSGTGNRPGGSPGSRPMPIGTAAVTDHESLMDEPGAAEPDRDRPDYGGSDPAATFTGYPAANAADLPVPSLGRVIRPVTAEPAGSDGPDAGYPAGPDVSYLDYFDDELDDRYIPPPVPPLPRLDPVAKGAWAGLFGGPAYLVIAMLLGWQLTGLAALAAIAAFVAGFAILVFRLGDGPSRGDGPDQGAVI